MSLTVIGALTNYTYLEQTPLYFVALGSFRSKHVHWDPKSYISGNT
jgi:hypothetical protein